MWKGSRVASPLAHFTAQPKLERILWMKESNIKCAYVWERESSSRILSRERREEANCCSAFLAVCLEEGDARLVLACFFALAGDVGSREKTVVITSHTECVRARDILPERQRRQQATNGRLELSATIRFDRNR